MLSNTVNDILLNNKKFCECGCGELIDAFYVNRQGKIEKWNPRRFKNHHGKKGVKINSDQKEIKNNNWKGGSVIDDHGYRKVRCVGHPRATNKVHIQLATISNYV